MKQELIGIKELELSGIMELGLSDTMKLEWSGIMELVLSGITGQEWSGIMERNSLKTGDVFEEESGIEHQNEMEEQEEVHA